MSQTNYQEIVENWSRYVDAIKKIDGEIQASSHELPATIDEVSKLENDLGFVLPSSLKTVLLEFSKKVEFRWFFPDGFELEGPLNQIFSGDTHWSLEWIVQFNNDKKGWIDDVFPNREDPYDAVWHDKLTFHDVGNGDYFAIDLSQPGKEPVVYLSHDDGEGHGVELAPNFKEYVLLSSRLGSVGGEDWQWLPFIDENRQYLNPASKNAMLFKEALGIKL